jgi:multiple sugar transport system substrate-binding protein
MKRLGSQELSRRQLLKATGAAAAVAGVSGIGLFGGKAPAYAQAREIHVTAWAHFIPSADVFTRKQAMDFESQTKVKVTYETINANDIPAKASAAVSAGQGPDIFQFQWNQPWIYEGGISDMGKLAKELGSDKTYKWMQEAAVVNHKWRGVPFYAVGNAHAYRKDWFKEAGASDPQTVGLKYTFDDYLADGTKLKKAGHPFGITMGHTFGDAPANCYPLLWSYGGEEVDKKGKVAIYSNETKAALEMMMKIWPACAVGDELAWDDTSNNRAYYAGTISCTQNGASIYINSKSEAQDKTGLWKVTGHFLNPKGPAGRFHPILNMTHSIMNYSPNKDAAADWLRFVQGGKKTDKYGGKQYEEYIVMQQGYGLGATAAWENHPMWKKDPALEPFRLNAKYGRNFGYAGPYNRAASEAQVTYIIIDMFAKVIGDQKQTPEQAMKWAEGELKRIYEKA